MKVCLWPAARGVKGVAFVCLFVGLFVLFVCLLYVYCVALFVTGRSISLALCFRCCCEDANSEVSCLSLVAPVCVCVYVRGRVYVRVV